MYIKVHAVIINIIFMCRHCLTYCFESIIEKELQLLVDRWNKHNIRKNRAARMPHGVPNDLFQLPEIMGKYKIVIYTSVNRPGIHCTSGGNGLRK